MMNWPANDDEHKRIKQRPHTLCPIKVPIQSPLVPDRSIGCPSLLALTRKYPSAVTLL